MESAPELFCLPQFVPKYVMGDAHKGISAAARVRFPQAKRLVCYFHMKDRLTKKGKCLLPVGNREVSWARVQKQVFDMHRAPTDEIFNELAKVVLQEWHTTGWKEFAEYFEKQWLKECPLW